MSRVAKISKISKISRQKKRIIDARRVPLFLMSTDDPDDPDKASAHPRLDQTQMRSKNPWFDLLAGCYKFVYPLSETGTFIQDSADPLLQYIIYGSWAASYYVFLP